MRNLLVIPLLLLMLCFKSYANNPSTASRISHVQFKEYSDEMERKTKSEVAHEIQRIKDALEYKTAKGKISRPVAFVLATTLSTLTYMLITGGVTHYFMHQGDDGSVNNGDPKPTKGDGSAKGGGSKPGISLANLLSLITLANLLSLITLANLLSLLHLLILVKKVRDSTKGKGGGSSKPENPQPPKNNPGNANDGTTTGTGAADASQSEDNNPTPSNLGSSSNGGMKDTSDLGDPNNNNTPATHDNGALPQQANPNQPIGLEGTAQANLGQQVPTSSAGMQAVPNGGTQPAAGDQNKPAPSGGTQPAAGDQNKPAPSGGTQPAAGDQNKPAPSGGTQPAAGDQNKPAPSGGTQPAAGDQNKPAPSGGTQPAAGDQNKPAPNNSGAAPDANADPNAANPDASPEDKVNKANNNTNDASRILHYRYILAGLMAASLPTSVGVGVALGLGNDGVDVPMKDVVMISVLRTLKSIGVWGTGSLTSWFIFEKLQGVVNYKLRGTYMGAISMALLPYQIFGLYSDLVKKRNELKEEVLDLQDMLDTAKAAYDKFEPEAGEH